jgi:uncharacterized membrane protein YphA (DoxX/SURF4 family)
MAQRQTIAHREEPRPLIAGRLGPLRGELRDSRYQAFLLLWIAFVVAPILFGLDKFFNWMTYWPEYLWVGFPHFFGHVSSLHVMYAVGVIEIAAGLLVFLLPRFAPYVVAGWLAGIITNLVILSAARGGHTDVYWDIARRDFGLLLAALALARLGAVYAPNPFRPSQRRAGLDGTGADTRRAEQPYAA